MFLEIIRVIKNQKRVISDGIMYQDSCKTHQELSLYVSFVCQCETGVKLNKWVPKFVRIENVT